MFNLIIGILNALAAGANLYCYVTQGERWYSLIVGIFCGCVAVFNLSLWWAQRSERPPKNLLDKFNK